MKALRKNLQLSLALLLSLYAPLSLATLTDDLQLVGEARLRVLFWSIYDSSLYTITGRYFGVEPKLTLRINYLRKIKSRQLLDRTSEEWEKNSIIEQDIETWLEKLASILPDVKKGETLTLQVEDNLSSSFYLKDELIAERKVGYFEKPTDMSDLNYKIIIRISITGCMRCIDLHFFSSY